MKEYERTHLIITEFDKEDIITTSGEPQSQIQKTVTMNSPNYNSSNNSGPSGWNWTLWQ